MRYGYYYYAHLEYLQQPLVRSMAMLPVWLTYPLPCHLMNDRSFWFLMRSISWKLPYLSYFFQLPLPFFCIFFLFVGKCLVLEEALLASTTRSLLSLAFCLKNIYKIFPGMVLKSRTTHWDVIRLGRVRAPQIYPRGDDDLERQRAGCLCDLARRIATERWPSSPSKHSPPLP